MKYKIISNFFVIFWIFMVIFELLIGSLRIIWGYLWVIDGLF